MGTDLYIFASLSFPVLFFALLFNICGIFLLKSLPGIEVTQKIIIMHLSLSESFLAVGWIAQLTTNLNGLNYDDRLLQFIWAIRAGVYCFWFSNMYILSLDRLVSCIFALKHRAKMNKRFLRRLMIVLWILCSVKSVLLLMFNTRHLYQIYNTFVWITLDIIAVVIYSFTYISIFLYTMKREKQKRARTHSLESRENIQLVNPHFLKVVSFIIVSFIVFEVIPSITEFFFFAKGQNIPQILEGIVFLSYHLALLIDPLIYIFVQSRVRRFLFIKIRMVFGQISRE